MTSRIWSDAALLAALSYINEHLKDFRDDHAQGYEDCAFNLLQQKDIPTQFTPKQIQCKVGHLLNECFRGGLSHMRHVDQFFLYGTQVLKDSFWVDKINAKQFMSGLNALLPPGTPLFQQAVTTQRAQSQQMAKRLKNRLIHDQSPSSDQGLCSSNPHGSRQIDERVGRKRIHSQDAEQREELEEPLQRTACQQMDFASTGPKKLTLWFSGHAEIEDVGRREHRERPKRLRAGSPDTGPAPEQRLTSPDQAEPLSGAQRPSAVEDCSSGANQTQRPQRAQHRTTNGLTEKILEASTAEHEQARPSTDTTAPPRGGFFSAQPALINDIGDEEIKKSMSAIQGMIKDTVVAFNRHTELDDIPFPDLQVIQHRYPALAKLIEQVLGVSNVASLAQAFATSGIKPLSTNGWLRALIGAAVTNDVFRASFPEELICNPTPFFAKLQKEWDSPGEFPPLHPSTLPFNPSTLP